MKLQQFKKEFDTALNDYLTKKIQELKKLYSENAFDHLLSYLYAYVDEGKRFRPYLLYLFYMACGGKDISYSINVGISFELLHVFALIHDDICDKGTIRHSKDTYHIRLGKKLGNNDQGISQAMLIGDMLLFRAQDEFRKHVSNESAHHQFSHELQELVYGQMMDVYFSGTDVMFPPETISLKDKLKSGRYSFTRPICIGSILAQHEIQLDKIEHLGDLLGEAFQLRDDLIDILDEKSNKTTFSDILEGNQTLLFAYAYAHATDEQKRYLLHARHKVLSEAEKKQLKKIYTETGAIEHTMQTHAALLEEARKVIHEISWENPSYVTHMIEIVELLSHR